MGQIRPDRQTLLWTATWPREVAAVAQALQRDAYKLTVGSAALTANHRIAQLVEVVQDPEKRAAAPALPPPSPLCPTPLPFFSLWWV